MLGGLLGLRFQQQCALETNLFLVSGCHLHEPAGPTGQQL
jgi:hypothetical protein